MARTLTISQLNDDRLEWDETEVTMDELLGAFSDDPDFALAFLKKYIKNNSVVDECISLAILALKQIKNGVDCEQYEKNMIAATLGLLQAYERY